MTIPARLLPQTVQIEASRPDGTFDAAVTVRARVNTTRQLVVSENGAQEVSEATVYVPADTVAPPRSRIVLPGDTIARTVLTASPVVGARLPHHLKLTTR